MTSDSTSADLTVLVIEDNPGDRRLIVDVLTRAQPRVQVESVDRLSDGLDRLARAPIDVVLLDLSLPDSNGLQTFASLHSRYPSVAVVVMTGFEDEELAFRAINLGAQDYLEKNHVEPRELIRALRHAAGRQRRQSDSSAPGSRGRVVSVVSANGGAGKTLVSINLAATLAEAGEAPVGLIDLDLRFGDIGELLQVSNDFVLARFARANAAESAGLESADAKRDLLEQTRYGFHILKSHSEPALGDCFQAADVEKLLGVLVGQLRTTVVDTGCGFDSRWVAAVRCSDTVVVIADAWKRAIGRTHKLLAWLRELSVQDDRIILVVNKHGAEESIPADVFQEQLGVSMAAVIPNQPFAALRTVNEGIPANVSAPQSGLAAVMRHLAAAIAATPIA